MLNSKLLPAILFVAGISITACTPPPESNSGSSNIEPTGAPNENEMKITGKNVEYTVGGKTMEGYLAAPEDSDSRRPAVLVIQDWNGIDDYERMRADMLAKMGYVAFCADIYGKGIRPANPDESAKESGKYYANHALLMERVNGGLGYLRKQTGVRVDRIAAIGYCFGGMAVLELARSGADVRGVVSFHGSLATENPLKPNGFAGKVVVLHGAADPFVPTKDVDALKKEMSDAKADFEFEEYIGAVHAFTVVGVDDWKLDGAKYDEAADKASWAHMTKTFDSILKK